MRRGAQITPLRAACGPRAVSLRPLLYNIEHAANVTQSYA